MKTGGANHFKGKCELYDKLCGKCKDDCWNCCMWHVVFPRDYDPLHLTHIVQHWELDREKCFKRM